MNKQKVTERKVVQINYWKRMFKEINEVIGKLHGIVLLLHNSVELSDIINFLNETGVNKQLRVIYITFINSYDRIKETLKEHPLESKKLYVIDCVTPLLADFREDTPGCEYKKPPDNLEQLKNMLMEKIEEKNPNIVVIDSMSQFINFSTPIEEELEDFYKFLNSIKQNVRQLSDDSIILRYDDKLGPLQKLPTISIDLVLKLEVVRDKPRWKD